MNLKKIINPTKIMMLKLNYHRYFYFIIQIDNIAPAGSVVSATEKVCQHLSSHLRHNPMIGGPAGRARD